MTDEPWAFIEPLRLPQAKIGRPRIDDHKMIDGIRYVLVAGCRWFDRPCPYGAALTAWRRPQALQEKGIWEKIVRNLLGGPIR